MRPLVCSVALALSSLCATAMAQGTLNISRAPLAGGAGVAPNLLYIHDDSGSMSLDYMPDGVYASPGTWYPSDPARYYLEADTCSVTPNCKNPAVNKIYYNPAVTYAPPFRARNDGTPEQMENADFNNAWVNGYDPSRNAAGNYPDAATQEIFNATRPWNYWPRRINLSNPAQTNAWRIYVGHHNGSAWVPLPADQRQNFANWFSYYRTRNQLAKAGVSRAFKDLNPTFRVGYGRICTGLGSPDGATGACPHEPYSSQPKSVDGSSAIGAIDRGVRPFEGLNKKQFYDWLLGINRINANTPLRTALDWAGKYYENSSTSGPWADTPGTPNSAPMSACRKSYTLLMTDGYWNQGAATGGAANNNDNTAGTAIPRHSTGPTYTYAGTEMNPFRDSYSDTLADIAMYYWKRDLLPGLENRVSPTVRDPAYWQHMTTFTVGLGVNPNLTNRAAAFAAADARTTSYNWPNGTSEIYKIDDLLHAGVNGHGDFMAANNPEEFEAAIAQMLAHVSTANGATGAMAANSTSLTSESRLYQSSFDSATWSGTLKASALCTPLMATSPGCTVGSLLATGGWTATIPAHGSRKILTWDPVEKKSVDFAVANLTAAQKTALGIASSATSSPLLNYLRGDTSGDGSTYRNRQGNRLGDIVNSGVLYADPGVDSHGWAKASSVTPAQRQAYWARMSDALAAATTPSHKRTVFVGANDGMLHAFNADTGEERFAYVPDASYEYLKELANPDYTHRYFVDGTPVSGDIDLAEGSAGSSDWHTLVVTSTGAGGRAYFALDVENMTAPKALWEVSGGGDNLTSFPATAGFEALGVTIGKASIVRTNNADTPWVAIFGNGYNSRSDEPQKARLFIVNAKTGALIRQISTGVGSPTEINGLATPLAVDYDGNGTADAVYAGDLQGNLWKFDLTGAADSWNLAFGGKPLLKATDTGGRPQPITAQPEAMRRKGSSGQVMVYVGTGRYFEVDDPENKQVQSFYGVADPCGSTATCLHSPTGAAVLDRNDLTQQTLTAGGADTRTLSNVPLAAPKDKGFYIDLRVNTAEGERVIANALMYYDRILFSTLIPSGDSCGGSTDSWLYAVDPWQGGKLDFSVFGDPYGNVSGVKIPGGSGSGIVPIGERVYTGPDSNFQNRGNIPHGRRMWRDLR